MGGVINMNNQRIGTVIFIGLLLLAVSCQAETSTSGITTTGTSRTGRAEQTVGPTTVVQEEPTIVPEEMATPAVPATPVKSPGLFRFPLICRLKL